MSDSELILLPRLLSLDRANFTATANTSNSELFDQKNTLPQVFGDVFLCQHNRLFAKVRTTALALGYRYSNERNDDYEALPFTKLEDLLEAKTIPVVHNRRAIETLALKVPEATWIDIADGFRRCFAFHESCHAIARETLMPNPQTNESAHERVLRSMIEESFANTCELIGVRECDDLSGLVFYEANSYTALWEAKDLLDTIEMTSSVFKFVLLNYLRANFLMPTELESAEEELIHLLSGTKPQENLKDLSNYAYTLDENFRHTTSRLHLRLHGLPTDLESHDPIQELSKNTMLLSKLDQLVNLVTNIPASRHG